MTEVIGIKFEENGAVEYVVPDKNYTKGDFVVVLEKKDKRLAQVVMENTDFPEVSLPAELNQPLLPYSVQPLKDFHHI